MFNEINNRRSCHCCTNMNSDVCNNGKLTPSGLNREGTQLWCLGWFVVNEKQGKQESLNHYNIIMDVFNQNTLQERPHNIHKIDFLEKQYIATMKNYSALSNLEYELP